MWVQIPPSAPKLTLSELIATLAVRATGSIFKHDISEFLDFFCVRVKQIGINGSLLEAVVDYILPCKNMDKVAEKLNAVVKGYDDPVVKAEIQQKLQKQVLESFGQ
ncbi:MAG: hypothetical protein HYU63_03295 [Armatimonadetes bacterium]|nr:hypothetical protein [Armatimonadota bacterium]